MGLNSSKKEEVQRSEVSAASLIIKKGLSAKRPLRNETVITHSQRYLPDHCLITETNSSLFIDEDGDMANEFYYEKFEAGDQLARLVRKLDNLRPKGRVKYPIPRLNPRVPFVMWEVHTEHC